MPSSPSLILYALIIGCEVAFWLLLLASLATCYLLRREALSRWLLYALPLVDLLLVLFTALDLKAGTVATRAHGLAAAYVGFTLAFGSVAIRWADAQFAWRFAGAARPAPAPSGWAAVRLDLDLWLRCIVAWIIAFALIELLVAYVDNAEVTRPLYQWHKFGFGCVVFWLIFGPLWSLLAAVGQRGAR